MAEADDDFAIGDAAANVGLGFVGRVVALLDLERHFIGAAVLGPLERADGAADAGVHIGAGAGDDARGERGSVELVLGIEDERDLHGVGPLGAGRFAVQQMQEVLRERFAVGVDAMRLPWCA